MFNPRALQLVEKRARGVALTPEEEKCVKTEFYFNIAMGCTPLAVPLTWLVMWAFGWGLK